MIISPDFYKYISYLDLDYIEKSLDVIYIVDNTMVLKAFNDAWASFAQDNNGVAILKKFPIGSNISDVGEEPLKSYFFTAYEQSLNENKPFEQNYECSSADEYRLFRQTAYPLVEQKGLVITHHLFAAKPHEINVVNFSRQYCNEHDNIVQCQNCRKIRDPDNDLRWIWVPSIVENQLPNISHGICPPCLDHYYPNLDVKSL